jgi:hypothetical protein
VLGIRIFFPDPEILTGSNSCTDTFVSVQLEKSATLFVNAVHCFLNFLPTQRNVARSRPDPIRGRTRIRYKIDLIRQLLVAQCALLFRGNSASSVEILNICSFFLIYLQLKKQPYNIFFKHFYTINIRASYWVYLHAKVVIPISNGNQSINHFL